SGTRSGRRSIATSRRSSPLRSASATSGKRASSCYGRYSSYSLRSRRRLVAVCRESAPRTSLGDLAFELGRGIAERDAVLICGGLTGVMEHAARGARSVGGLTIGLLPGDDPNDANEYIDLAIATSLGHGRDAGRAKTADGGLALGCGRGTLS